MTFPRGVSREKPELSSAHNAFMTSAEKVGLVKGLFHHSERGRGTGLYENISLIDELLNDPNFVKCNQSKVR